MLLVNFSHHRRIQEFWKGGPIRGRNPEPSAEGASAGGGLGPPQTPASAGGGLGPPPENFEKLDAISCNLAYIFGIRMASFKIGHLQNKKQ